MFTLELKRNGNYFKRSIMDKIFGITGTISLNTTERIMEYDNICEILNDIFTEDKWDEFTKITYNSLSTFMPFYEPNPNVWQAIPIEPKYNTLSICNLGLTILGKKAIVNRYQKNHEFFTFGNSLIK